MTQLARAMSEAELQLKITSGTRKEPGICAQLGLLWHHQFDSRRSNHGWPDLVIARRHVPGYPGGAVLFAELKRETEKVTAAQQAWLEALTFAGLVTRVWRPGDLLSGAIAWELTALATQKPWSDATVTACDQADLTRRLLDDWPRRLPFSGAVT